MNLSSPFFLFAFLPAGLAVFHAVPARKRGAALLLLSLCFYALADAAHLPLLVLSAVFNHAAGRGVAARAGKSRRAALFLAVTANVAILAVYKYLPFLAENLWRTGLLPGSAPGFGHWTLPLGVSFFTFGAISHLIDVARGTEPPSQSLVSFTLFTALFPKIAAGPIARHADLSASLARPEPSLERAAGGVSRFCVGLAKKTLLAAPAGAFADLTFAAQASSLDAATAWLGLLCYTLQIYYDFSGYTDMAIGLGRMFGLTLPENFNLPYLSRSIQEFWRRWHITLSLWFRDYLYFPLGGNRKGLPRTLCNLCLVFALCGLWHGAGWSFLAWGLWHGLFLVLERLFLSKTLSRAPRVFGHVYALTAIMLGWVFFRAPDLAHAVDYFAALFSMRSGAFEYYAANHVNRALLAAILLGVACCGPLDAAFQTLRRRLEGSLTATAAALTLFVLAAMHIAGGTQAAFIYARF
jgi:alginate O-acetyltransferase complex protein AlgI